MEVLHERASPIVIPVARNEQVAMKQLQSVSEDDIPQANHFVFLQKKASSLTDEPLLTCDESWERQQLTILICVRSIKGNVISSAANYRAHIGGHAVR